MNKQETTDDVLAVTENILNDWHNKALFAAPNEAKDILSSVNVKWMKSLTNELVAFAKESDKDFSDGKLILANAALGAMVENWLKYFFAVYFDDYKETDSKIHRRPNDDGSYELYFPENLTLERLKQLAKITWVSKEISDFISTVQHRRNLIHSFNKDISLLGNTKDFYENFELYDVLLNDLQSRLPALEDIYNY